MRVEPNLLEYFQFFRPIFEQSSWNGRWVFLLVNSDFWLRRRELVYFTEVIFFIREKEIPPSESLHHVLHFVIKSISYLVQ